MPVTTSFAQRLQHLPPYLFAEIDKVRRTVIAQGKDVINLGVGDPDTPTPAHIVAALQRAALEPVNHQYALDQGKPALRQACAAHYLRRFGVRLDPDTEILPLLGSKEGIGHIHLAFVNPGEVVLVPEPGYPVYHSGTLFAGGVTHWMPLTRARNYLPDLGAIPADVARRARLMFLCYPNNPTAAVLSEAALRHIAARADAVGAWILADEVYQGAEREGGPPTRSFWGLGERVIVVNGLSKAYGLPGLRLGWSVAPLPLPELLWSRKDYITIGPGAMSDALATIALRPDVRAKIIERTRGIIRANWQVLAD